MAGFWGNERLTSLQAPLVSLDSESSESEAAHKVLVFNPVSWGKGHALHVVGGLCVCIWCTEKHMAGDSILTDKQIMTPIPFKPQLGTCACRIWGGDNTGTDNHRGNLVDLAGRQFHAGNGAGLQFRTRTFEPLLTWREESCASKVTALRDSSPESQEVTY